jgi:hypothetical protein
MQIISKVFFGSLVLIVIHKLNDKLRGLDFSDLQRLKRIQLINFFGFSS